MGIPHPDHLERILTHRQLTEWQAYYTLDPFGEERADLRAAHIMWASLQPWSKRKLKPERFMLRFGQNDDPPADVVDMKFRRWVALQNANTAK